MKLERGQVAVVTGGASGLGLALARAFAARGLEVVLADVEVAALDAAVHEIAATGAGVIGVPTDVRSGSALEGLASATLNRFGRVDVVCNNAGVVSFPGPTWEAQPADWEWVLSVNLHGVINGVRAFVPHFVAQGSGHVVNTASMAGISAGPGMAPYLVSKHAVVALTEGLAAELALAAPGVRASVVCPGQVVTNIATSRRNQPEELAAEPPRMSESEWAAFRSWHESISHEGISADEAAEIVLEGVEDDQLHIAPNGSSVGVHAWLDRLLVDVGEL
jgi:NAD(P)-dependent dehydrogenase (short-subunit alcohol dehydrogenase family)